METTILFRGKLQYPQPVLPFPPPPVLLNGYVLLFASVKLLLRS